MTFTNAHKAYVVDSQETARELADFLTCHGGPFGLDTETIWCNPKKQSPAWKALPVCWSLAWFPPLGPLHERTKTPLAACAFIWAEWLPYFRYILESERYPKVLQNAPYDQHTLANAGYTVRGIVADTKHLSRFWYSSKDVPHALKPQLNAVFGYKTKSYKALFSRPCQTKPKVYKRSGYTKKRTGPLAGIPIWVEAGEWPTFSHSTKKRELLPLEQIATTYPQRLPTLVDYVSFDAKGTLELFPYRKAQLSKRKARGTSSSMDVYDTYWQPMLNQLFDLERRGIYVDRDECGETYARLTGEAKEPGRVLAEWSPISFSSTPQMREFFFSDLCLPRPPIKGTLKAVRKAKSEEWSTSEASLLWLEANCPRFQQQFAALRKWRKITKAAQYARDLPNYIALDGRVHTVLGPDTDTGRLTSRNPGLHQMPSDANFGIRRVFKAAPGKVFIVADMSQLEIYIMAHMLLKLFGDNSLVTALTTGDVYTWIARECWPAELANLTDKEIKGHEKRKLAKIIVLATNYLKTPMGLALSLLDELGRPASEDQAQSLYDLYYSRLPGIANWHKWTADYSTKRGGIHSLLGRWRPIPDAMSDQRWLAARGHRQAANTPIQGSAMDVMTCAMLGLRHLPCLLQIHDELIFEVDEDKAEAVKSEVIQVMEQPPGVELLLKLKVEAKIARTWAEGK